MFEYFRVESIINERIEKENRKKKARNFSRSRGLERFGDRELFLEFLDRSSARKAGEEAQD